MTTLNELRQELEDLYLEPTSEETPGTTLTGDITSGALSFSITPDILSPDELAFIEAGRLLELDNELVRVTSFDASTYLVNCKRGVRGSEAVAHTAADCEVRIPTRWPRHRMIKTLRSAIIGLWQPLFATRNELSTVESAPWVPLPLNTVRILDVKMERPAGSRGFGSFDRWRSIPFEFFPEHPLDPNQASVQLAAVPYPSQLVRIQYGVRIEPPAGDDDTIEDLPSEYEPIVLAASAAKLLAGVDIDAQTQETLTQQIRLQGFPVGSGTSISNALLGFSEFLTDKHNKEITARYKRKIARRKAGIW